MSAKTEKRDRAYKQHLAEVIMQATDVTFKASFSILGRVFEKEEVTAEEAEQIMTTVIRASARAIANNVLSEIALIGLFSHDRKDIADYLPKDGEVDFDELQKSLDEEPKKK